MTEDERQAIEARDRQFARMQRVYAVVGGGEDATDRHLLLAALVEAEDRIQRAGAACPVCDGSGFAPATLQDENGDPYPGQEPCWDAEHSILLSKGATG